MNQEQEIKQTYYFLISHHCGPEPNKLVTRNGQSESLQLSQYNFLYAEIPQ
jgi:hypothetical protein